MKELKDIRFNETDIQLEDNCVKGSILPQRASELNRNIIINGNTIVEGPIYAHRLEINQGEVQIQGAVFADLELYVNTDVEGDVKFCKCVASSNSVVSRAAKSKVIFGSDINSKNVALYNAFVAGSIYADQVSLVNCVVIGGVFATRSIDEMTNCVVGTFNAPEVRIGGTIQLLLPSAFSRMPLEATAGTKMYNLALADLGALYKGAPESEQSGRISMNLDTDEIKSRLINRENGEPTNILSYTVIGKVLTADLVNTDNFKNHFLLTAASLGSQLLKTYDLGNDANGNPVNLSIENIRNFFFAVLDGSISIKEISGSFSMSELISQA